MQRYPVVAYVSGVLLFSSCASIFSSSRSAVPVRSEPSDAHVVITDRKGAIVFEGETPAIVDLNASSGYFKRGIYQVRVTKAGHEPHVEQLRARICGWYWGNLLLGGLLGMVLIDPATGAMYTLDNRFVFAKLYLIMSDAAPVVPVPEDSR